MGINPNSLSSEAQLSFYDNFNGSASSELWNAANNAGTWDTLNGPMPPGGTNNTQTPSGSQMGNDSESEWFINENYTNAATDGVSSPFTFGSGLIIQSSALTSAQQSALGTTATYASGAITSNHSYAQTYGYFEMDATLTDSFGSWPGFWMEPDSVNGPAGNKEIDVMEQYIKQDGSSTPSDLYSTIHDEPDQIGVNNAEGAQATISDSGVNEHKYGVDVESDYITFWVGSLVSGQWSYSEVGQFATPPAFLNLPMYMIADLALGSFAGPVSGDPAIHINSIEAYQAIGQNNGYAYTGDLNYTAGAGIGYIFLQSDASHGSQTVQGNDAGDVIGSVSFVGGIPNTTLGGIPEDPNDAAGGDSNHHPTNSAFDNTMIGGAGADKIYVSVGDTATGKGGGDTFVLDDVTYNWHDGSNSPATITDFGDGNDVIDTHFMEANYAQFGDGLSLEEVSSSVWDLWTVDSSDNNLNLQAVIDLAPGASGIHFADASDNSIVIDNPVNTGGGSSVQTAASPYTAPSGVTDITLTGASSQTIYGNNEGDTFHSNNNGNDLVGGTGDDTFDVGRAGDYVTTGGGTDVINQIQVPWAEDHISGFAAGDQLNLQTMLATDMNYAGSDPIGDGYLKFADDGSGDGEVQANYNISGNDSWWTVAVFYGVSESDLQLSNGIVTENSGSVVSTSASSYTAPSNVTSITLTGSSSQTIDASATDGVTIISDNNGNSLIGGAGADVFDIGRGGDWVTGNAGADTFSYAQIPWASSVITDFSAGDQLDVQTMLANDMHYSGSDPIGDGYLKFADDGSGDALVEANYNIAGNNGWWTVATLEHVSSSSLSYSNGMIT